MWPCCGLHRHLLPPHLYVEMEVGPLGDDSSWWWSLIRRTPSRFCCSLSSHSGRGVGSGKKTKDAQLCTRMLVLIRHYICWHLILNFSASRTVRNKHLGYPVYGILVLAAQMDGSQIASESPGSLGPLYHAPWSAKCLARLTWRAVPRWCFYFARFPTTCYLLTALSATLVEKTGHAPGRKLIQSKELRAWLTGTEWKQKEMDSCKC